MRTPEPGTLFELDAEQTDLSSGVVTHRKVTGTVRESRPGEFWLHLVDGVTGHESIHVDTDLAVLLGGNVPGWLACAGTAGSWPRLLVTSQSLVAVFGDPATPVERVGRFLDARASMAGPVDREIVTSVWVGGVEYELTVADLRAVCDGHQNDSGDR